MAARPKRKPRMIYNPGDDDYAKPDSKVIRSRIGRAVELGQAIRQKLEDVKAGQQINTEAIDYYIGLYKGTIPLGIPNDKRYVQFDAKTAKPADIIHRTMGMLLTPLRSQYIAPKDDEDSAAKAQVIMSHLDGAYEWLKRKHGAMFDHQSLFWQLLTGRGYIQQTYSPAYWNKMPLQKDGESNDDYNARTQGFKHYAGPPFFVQSLDPRIVYPIPTPQGKREWLKEYTVQRFDAEMAFERALGTPFAFEMDDGGKVKSFKRGTDARAYKKARSEYETNLKKGGSAHVQQAMRGTPGLELPVGAADNWSGNVTYYEYIDGQNIFYVCEDTVVYEYEHRGGVLISEGLGLTTGFQEFEMAAASLLFAVRHEIPQYDFLRTLWLNRAYMDVFPQLFAELGADEEPLKQSGTDENEVWWIEPGSIKQVRGRLSNPFKDGESGVDFRAAIEMMASDIDLATISGLARGIAGAQQPGYSINQLSQAMRTLWKPIIESRELQWSNLFEHYLWCVKHLIQDEVTVFAETPNESGVASGTYLSIEPDDIQDFYQVRARLKPDLPIDQQSEMLTWMKAGAEGYATEQEVSLNGFGEANWQSRRNRIERDRMRRTMFPLAAEAAIKLGNVMLENQIAQEMGYDQLNPVFSQSLASMRQQAGGTPTGGPPGELGAQGGSVDISTQAGVGEGAGVAPTVGGNPANPTPAARR